MPGRPEAGSAQVAPPRWSWAPGRGAPANAGRGRESPPPRSSRPAAPPAPLPARCPLQVGGPPRPASCPPPSPAPRPAGPGKSCPAHPLPAPRPNSARAGRGARGRAAGGGAQLAVRGLGFSAPPPCLCSSTAPPPRGRPLPWGVRPCATEWNPPPRPQLRGPGLVWVGGQSPGRAPILLSRGGGRGGLASHPPPPPFLKAPTQSGDFAQTAASLASTASSQGELLPSPAPSHFASCCLSPLPPNTLTLLSPA